MPLMNDSASIGLVQSSIAPAALARWMSSGIASVVGVLRAVRSTCLPCSASDRALAAYLSTQLETQRIQIFDDNKAHPVELPTSALRLRSDNGNSSEILRRQEVDPILLGPACYPTLSGCQHDHRSSLGTGAIASASTLPS